MWLLFLIPTENCSNVDVILHQYLTLTQGEPIQLGLSQYQTFNTRVSQQKLVMIILSQYLYVSLTVITTVQKL